MHFLGIFSRANSKKARGDSKKTNKFDSTTALSKEIWVLVASSVAIALGYGIVAPVIPQFAKSFEVTNFAATLVVSAFAFMRLAFAPAAGQFANRFNERNVYLFGISIVALSSFTAAFATNYWQLLIYRGLGGIGSVMFSVAAMSLIFHWAPEGARGRASAAYGSGFLLGNMAGPAVGALLSPLGFRPPFIIYAVFLGVAACIVAIMIPSEQHQQRKAKRQVRAAGASDLANVQNNSREVSGQTVANEDRGVNERRSRHRRQRRVAPEDTITVRQAWAIRRFRVILLTSFAQGWANMGVRLSIVPLLAATLVGAPVWFAGGMLTAFAVGNGISLLTSGRWSDIYGRRRLVIAGLFLSGGFTLFTGDVANPWILLLMSLFAGYGAGLVQPSQQGALADIIGQKNGGSVVSLFQQAGDFGAIFGPLVAGLIVDLAGFSLAYWVSGGVLIAVALVWLCFTHGK